jgi:hypothetical protein
MNIRKTAAVAAIVAIAAGFGSSVSASAASVAGDVPFRVQLALTLDEMNCISSISSHDPATIREFCGD